MKDYPMITSPRGALAGIAGAGAIAVLVSLAGVVPAATSAPDSNKVTICHRTHSVTNPYRMITVSMSAADGVGISDHTSHDVPPDYAATLPPVFDPTYSYIPRLKYWGDIIPPVRTSPGLNWTAPGAQAIYSGTGTGYGLCTRMSAKQFFDVEVAALPEDLTPEERDAALDRILDDLDEQEAADDEAAKDELGITEFSELDPSALPEEFENLPSRPRGPRPPAGYGPEDGRQKLAVLVWWDVDEDGEYDEDELPAANVTVVIEPVLAPTSAPALTSAVGEVTTDANGLVIVDSLDAGQWNARVRPPTGSSVTWDSQGLANDGEAQAEVPANSAGFAWTGLVRPSTTDGGDALAATGSAETTAPALVGLSALLVAIGAALLRTRPRPRGRHAAQ
jgi:LPXTG-motif cell wall-anchored protein